MNEKDSGRISFKTRVKVCAIENASKFKARFIDCEYCVISKAFHDTGFHILKSLDGNYLHLVGVNTTMPPATFFRKCINRSLSEDDFNFRKQGVDSEDLKGTVRQKIKVLPEMMEMFSGKELMAQDNFKKNKIMCAFASSDKGCTLGFAGSGHPKSLLKGNKLDNTECAKVDMILKRNLSDNVFSNIVYVNNNVDFEYVSDILFDMLDDGIKEKFFSKKNKATDTILK